MQLKELQSAVKELEASLPDAITPYRMMKITNTLLSTNLPPQMFYNYVAHGYISASTVNIDGKTVKTVKRSEVIRWITKYAIQNVISEF